jgi:hypothetical protein
LIHVLQDVAQLLFEDIDQILQQDNLSFHQLRKRRNQIKTIINYSSSSS